MNEIIYINVIKPEILISKEKHRIEEGFQKTAGRLEMQNNVISNMVEVNLNKKSEKGNNKLNELLENANEIIGQIASSFSQSINAVPNHKETEIEFGIGITEGLKLGIFSLGSQQSIKVKIKLAKE